jgi:hypothetical protein
MSWTEKTADTNKFNTFSEIRDLELDLVREQELCD